MSSTRFECRILAISVSAVLVVGGIALHVLVGGSAERGPVVAVCASVAALCVLFGVALFVTALLRIERHRADHVVEEMFFRAIALTMVIVGVAMPICEVAKIPSFVDDAVWAYRWLKQQEDPAPGVVEDVKKRFLEDATARGIRLSFGLFLPVGGPAASGVLPLDQGAGVRLGSLRRSAGVREPDFALKGETPNGRRRVWSPRLQA